MTMRFYKTVQVLFYVHYFGVSKMHKKGEDGVSRHEKSVFVYLCLFLKQICLRFLVQVWETIYWEIMIKAGVEYNMLCVFLGGRLRNFRRTFQHLKTSVQYFVSNIANILDSVYNHDVISSQNTDIISIFAILRIIRWKSNKNTVVQQSFTSKTMQL